MAVNVSIAPFINVEFYLTGAFREPRGDHLHKGVDLSTGTDGSVYTIDSGEVIAKGYGLGYYGYLITWNRETNKGTLYGDLRQEPALIVGMPVAAGQFIGVEGPVDSRHVHIERKTQTSDTWDFNQDIDYYDNPCDYMQGLINVVTHPYSPAYIYDGTPVPPTPPEERKKRKFPFVLYANKLRNKNKLV